MSMVPRKLSMLSIDNIAPSYTWDVVDSQTATVRLEAKIVIVMRECVLVQVKPKNYQLKTGTKRNRER